MDSIDVFVKFNGDIEKISELVKSKYEILDYNLAIFKLNSEQIKKLRECSQVQQIEFSCISSICSSERNNNFSSICYENIPENLTGKGIIIAILDSGIDFKHPDFIDSNGNSRILYIWDQNRKGKPPEGFDFGTEYSNAEINMAINGDINIENIDIDGHGTAVSSISAGNSGVASESNIIAVKLLSNDSASSTSTSNLSRAVKYAIEKAESLQMPIVINISYGTNQGAHDGQSIFEQYLDSVSEKESVAIVVATGNEGVSKHHFEKIIKTGETVNIEFYIKNFFKSFILSFVSSFYDHLNYRIINSTGEQSDLIDLRNLGQQTIFFEKVRVTLYLDQPTPINEGQQIIVIFSAIEDFIPKGTWNLQIIAKDIVDGRIDAWLPITSVAGLETQFLDPTVQTTLTIPSSSRRVISVGAYDTSTNDVSSFSGRGYTRNNFVAPDLVAPGVSINSANIGGGYASFTGTSFAAPFVSGACAIMMQWGIVDKNDTSMYGQRLKAFLKLGAKKRQNINYPNFSWGYGSLCLNSSLDYAKKYASIKVPDEVFIKDYSQFQGLQINNQFKGLENENGEKDDNPVTSEKYLDFIINNDKNSGLLLQQESNIKISSILQGKYEIIHVPVETYEFYKLVMPDYVLAERAVICGVAQGSSAINASGIYSVQEQPFLQLRGLDVLVGVVDTGIDFNNDCFKYENGKSKILYLWDQESNTGVPPEGFIYGSEYNNDQINSMMSENYNASNLDEVGHGTFISSVIAGRNFSGSNFVGICPDSNIIFVKLKKAKKVMKELSGIYNDVPSYESTDIMSAVEYILNVSNKINKPVVINVPLQTNEGSHDGLSYFEQYMSEISYLIGVGIVIPVGNQANKSGHLKIRLRQDESYKVEFNVANNEPGFSINIWTSTPDRISVSISTPLGYQVDRKKFTTNEHREYAFVLEKTKIQIQYVFPDEKNGNQNIIIKFVDPVPGLWNLEIFGDLILYGVIDLWMPISQFLTPGTAFLSTTTDETITIPSTARNVIAVGAYDHVDGSIYLSSGRGDSSNARSKPNFVAPGVEVSGIYPRNLEGEMTGTGVASAIAAGASALLLEWGISQKNDLRMNSTRIRSYMIIGCSQNKNVNYPNEIWGYGAINLLETFKRIR